MQENISLVDSSSSTPPNSPIQNNHVAKIFTYLSYPLIIILTVLIINALNQTAKTPLLTSIHTSFTDFIKQNCETNQHPSNKLRNSAQLPFVLPAINLKDSEPCVKTTDINNVPMGTYLSFKTSDNQIVTIYDDSAGLYLNRGGYSEIGPLPIFIGYQKDIRYSYALSHGDGGCIAPELVGLVLRAERDLILENEVIHTSITQTAWPAGDSSLVNYLDPEIIICDPELGGSGKTISPFAAQHLMYTLFPSGITGPTPLSSQIQNLAQTISQIKVNLSPA